MSQTVKVLLIEDNRMEATQTVHWLNAAHDAPFEVECVDCLQAGLDRLAQGGIDIVLSDLNLPDSRGLETFAKLHGQAPEIPVVVLTGEYDESLGPLAVENGAEDYLVKQEANAGMLNRVMRHALARRRALLEGRKQAPPAKIKRVIGLIGAKGGVGTTTTALNIALSLAVRGKPVILAELRPSFGVLSCHLHANPKGTLRGLLDLPAEQIGARQLDSVLCQDQAGLRVLFGPQHAEDSKEIAPQQAEAIVKGLSQLAEIVLLDLPSQPSCATEAAVRLCDFVAVVIEREPAAVAAGKEMVAQLQCWGVGSGLMGAVIVNRTVFPISMELAEIQTGMGCPIVGLIPWAATACLRALREGAPLVVGQRDNDASFSYAEIADKIAANKLVPLTL
ncbi:MAG TPA: response regulator [Pirellulales bacterium]|nr:response regulator [Pirellulales bacterium]